MKILHLYSSRTAGGAEKIMVDLASELQKFNCENIIAAPYKSYLYRRAEDAGLKVYSFGTKGSFDPIGLFRLWSVIRKEKPDVLHAHQGKVFWPCVIMKILSGNKLKIVFHRHAQLAHRFYSRSHYTRADRVIAISKAVADGLIKREKVAPEKISVVYNGIDLNQYSPDVDGSEIRKKFGLKNDQIVIGTIGAMNKPKGKGQRYLIDAARILKNTFSNLRYMVVGQGAIFHELNKQVKELGLEKEVIFTGYQPEVEKFIAAMDIFCLLSWDTEGFGQVMIEAQSMKKPVIGTNVGGVPETFISDQTGYLIEPENPEILAQKLDMLIKNEQERKRFGMKGTEFVSKNFSINKMAENTFNIYKEL